MFVVRRKGTNEYAKNNGFFEPLDEKHTSAIRLYQTERLAKSSVKGYEEDFDFVSVDVTIESEETSSVICHCCGEKIEM